MYQLVTSELKALQAGGVDTGKAIRYCTDNAFELTAYFVGGMTVSEIVKVCLDNK